MRLENIREEFPEMPRQMRVMVEQEVARQLEKEAYGAAKRCAGEKLGRRAGKLSGKRVAALGLAATMVTGLTAIAGSKVYELYNEKVSRYSVKTGARVEGADTELIPEVEVRVGYLPEGLYQCDVCGAPKYPKYHFKDNGADDPHVGGVSLVAGVIDTEGDLGGMVDTNVVEQKKMTIGDHEAVYLKKNQIDSGGIGHSRILYIMYPEVQRILQIYVGDDMPEDALLEMAEGIELIPTGETLDPETVYTWNDYVKDQEETEGYEAKVTAAAEEMEKLHAIGEEITMPMRANTPAEEFAETTDIRIRVADVQTADDLSLLGDSEYVEDRWKNEIGEDGTLKPDTVQYVKRGDGRDTVDQVVRTEELAQKLVYVTLEYTNTGEQELTDILFFPSIMAIAQQEDGYILYEAKKRQEEDGAWDAAYSTGAAFLGELDYYDVHGGERQNNYIPSIQPGETVTVHIANIVHEEELPYLYLNLSGSGYEFDKDALETGYVDIRQNKE